MVRMRYWLVMAALLALLSACAAPPPASSASSPPPSASAMLSPPLTPSLSPASTTTPIPMPNTAQLSAPSANVLWTLVAGSRLFRSADRGETWQDRSAALPVGPNFEIAFVTDTEGWLATPGQPGTQCTFQSVGVAHTVDAAAMWEQLVVAASAATAGLGDRKCKGGLAFAAARRGFLGAWDPNSPPVIYRT